MTAFAIEASAEYGHESDDVLCKLFFESLSGLILKHADSGMRFTAQQSNKGSAKTQQAVFIDDGERVNFALKNSIQKTLKAGLVAIETGTDVGDDLFASR